MEENMVLNLVESEHRLADGDIVEVDAEKGVVRKLE